MRRLFLIGANKAGTTSLHRYLASHPQIFMTGNKEPTFYSYDPAEGRPPGPFFVTERAAYDALFADAGDALVAGESSTGYLPNWKARERILDEHPDARILVVLRDPAARAHSAHSMMVSRGTEPSTRFSDAVERELAGDRTSNYLRLSRYADDVAAWSTAFPDGRMRITFYEDLQSDPRNFLAGVHEWLGVAPDSGADVDTRHHVTVVPANSGLYRAVGRRRRLLRITRRTVPASIRRRARNRLEEGARAAPLDPATRARLVEHFAEDVDALEAMTGRDLSAWRTA